ncbi:putative DNA replication regulator Sld3 [Rosellinia necatrix]|uniref:Putative DNA replication regulator Sld3 n=1 Tax=Rosellinia necatrix TaxID=77044 RepID=A0A1S7UJ09_ROSNE|nr:putative DNA replication regulator Sld3 [Rosellinia necatrix]
MSTRVQDPDASRRRPQSALSCSDPLLRHGNGTATDSVKARDALAMAELLRPSIVIKPHPPNLTVKPRSLQPLMLLPRKYLRLSFLDLSSPYGSFQPSASFEANIRILDLESRMGNSPVVLIARLESNKSVYAVERQAKNLYTLCRLGAWVDLEQLCDMATVSCLPLIREQPAPPTEPITHVPLTTPQISHTNTKRRLAIEAIQSLVKKPARPRSISALSQAGDISRPPTPIQESDTFDGGNTVMSQGVPGDSTHTPKPAVEPEEAPVQNQDDVLGVSSAGEIFINIRNHYFEALYHSMGSLAYFAKGPLSRARAAFHLDCDSTLEMCDLVGFLKSLVLTTVQIDKKYRETVPKIQLEMKNTIDDSDGENEQGQSKSKKRKVKKMKLGKDGLYPNEDDHIRRWWTINKPLYKNEEESTTKSTEQQDIKLQISLLRSRETQLQMIVILEILSLESSVAREIENYPQLPGLPPAGESLNSPDKIPTKKRNKHNFPTLLDVHADRLCIWQSTAFDEFNVINEVQIGSRPQSRKSLKSTSDPLKDFCVDIIVPFFSAKLPEYCNSINRKLGGPVMMPSPSPSQKKSEATPKAKPKPGAAAKRPALSKSHQSLEKFLSKETERNRRSISRGPGGVIALMRSASTPTVPLLKREASEPRSLGSIPTADASVPRGAHLPSTGPMAAKRRAETKEKRDAFVNAALQDAISTLRRPNREVVGKAMAEANERRTVTSLSQLRKSKKPTQHKSQSVVKATPVGSRFHDVLAKEHKSQPVSLQQFNGTERVQDVPSSSMVPSSAPRKRNRDTAFGDEQGPQAALGIAAPDQIFATPAKPSAPNRNFLSVPRPDEGVVFASSPIMPRTIAQPSFVAKRRATTLAHRDSGVEIPPSPGSISILGETPVKARQNNAMTTMDHYVTVTPVKKGTRTNSSTISIKEPEVNNTKRDNTNTLKKKMTIFERLGWDDDYDELDI